MATKKINTDLQLTAKLLDGSGSAGTSGQILSSTGTATDWISLSEISGVDGTGTANYIAKWSDADTIGSSIIYDNGTNVGIGTNSPSNKLDIAGGLEVNAEAYIRGTSNVGLRIQTTDQGTTSTDGLRVGLNSIHAFVWQYEALPLSFATSNAERVRIDSLGNVGIGTTNPDQKLTINNGNISMTDSYSIRWGNNYLTGLDSVDALRLFTAGTERMRIDSTGDVGIGTTNPTTKLHVAADNPIIQIQDTDSTIRYAALSLGTNGGTWFLSSGDNSTGSGVANSDLWITRNASGTDNRFRFHRDTYAFSIYSGSNQNVLLNANGDSYFNGGNFGIGTTNPGEKLVVIGSINSEFQSANFNAGNKRFFADGYESGNLARMGALSGASTDPMSLAIYTSASGSTGGVERMRIDSNGNVGIGTISPQAKFHIADSTSSSTDYKFFVGRSGGNTTEGLGIAVDDSGTYIRSIQDETAGETHQLTFEVISGASGNHYHRFAINNSEKMRIDSNGNVGIGTTSPNSKTEILETSINGEGAELRVINDGTGIGTGQTATITIGRNFDERNIKIKSVSSSNYGTKPELVITQNQNDSGTSHTEVLRINNVGNVGIGVASPVTALNVNGVITSEGGSWNGGGSESTRTDVGIVIQENDFIYTEDNSNLRRLIGKSGDIIQIGESATSLTDGVYFYSGTSCLYRWHSNSSVVMHLDANGLGIGTTNPTANLSIYDSSDWALIDFKPSATTRSAGIVFRPASSVSGSNTEFLVGKKYTNADDGKLHVWRYNGSSHISSDLVIDSDGNVGIGTTTPGSELEVDGEITTTTITYPEPGALDSSAYNGEIVYFGSEISMAAGNLMVLSTSVAGLTWYQAKDSTDSLATGMLGIALGTTASAGLLVRGIAKNSAWSSFSAGDKLYLSPTGGAISNSITVDTNDFVRIVGYALGNSKIYFCPDNTYIQNA